MIELTYTTREGAQWTLTDVVPDPHVRGFYWGRRQGDMHLLCVHEHRCLFHAAPAEGVQATALPGQSKIASV